MLPASNIPYDKYNNSYAILRNLCKFDFEPFLARSLLFYLLHTTCIFKASSLQSQHIKPGKTTGDSTHLETIASGKRKKIPKQKNNKPNQQTKKKTNPKTNQPKKSPQTRKPTTTTKNKHQNNQKFSLLILFVHRYHICKSSFIYKDYTANFAVHSCFYILCKILIQNCVFKQSEKNPEFSIRKSVFSASNTDFKIIIIWGFSDSL